MYKWRVNTVAVVWTTATERLFLRVLFCSVQAIATQRLSNLR